MGEVFNKIIVVSLCDSFTRKVGKLLAQNLGMFFCDVKELLEYELIDQQAMKNLCTIEYVQACEAKTFRNLASYENIVVAIKYDNLICNLEVLKEKSLIVFLKTSREFVKLSGEKVNGIAYSDRSKELKKNSSLTINIKKTEENFVCEKIITAIGGIL